MMMGDLLIRPASTASTTSSSAISSSSSESNATSTDLLKDEFREKEKQIKKYFSALKMKKLLHSGEPIYIEGSNSKQKMSNKERKKRLEEVNIVLENGAAAFKPSEVVDFRKEGVGTKRRLLTLFGESKQHDNGDSSCGNSSGNSSVSGGGGGNPFCSRAVICQLPAELKAADGFFVISEAMDMDSQLFWAKTAVERYSRSLHTNLTSLRKQSKTEAKGEGEISAVDKESAVKVNVVEVVEEDLLHLWEDSIRDADNFERFKPLRWASLGYHYDWTARMYQEHSVSPFPEDFSALCSDIAASLGLSLKSEAAIINYYPIGAMMSGHLDDAEHNLHEPIVSISIGCPAIFLLGHTTKDIPPVPILLRSGDIVVMSGLSRFCYHGVAAVLGYDEIGETSPFELATSHFEKGNENESVCSYLNSFRINLNARRVTLGSGQWMNKCGSGALAQAYKVISNSDNGDSNSNSNSDSSRSNSKERNEASFKDMSANSI